MKELLLVSCTRGAKEDTALHRSLGVLGPVDVRFFEHNREGLSARYNAVLDAERDADRIVVFVHDDVTLDDPAMRAKLNAALARGYAVSGLAGQSTFTIDHTNPIIMWMQRPYRTLSGKVRHRLADGSIVVSDYGPVPRRCVVMDGLFLAVHPPGLRGVRFDEQFAFHFYDLDFCLAAAKAGVVLGTTDVGVIHAAGSGDGYGSPLFKEAQAKFCAKWGDVRIAIDEPVPEGISRNDPCFCGSGLRYKHCHGREEPRSALDYR
jgi:hypothetical protein